MARTSLPRKTLDRARRLRRDMTDVERKLWSELRRQALEGWRFRRQAPIGPYFPDFVCHSAKLIVELDGGQHGEAEGRRHDAVRDAYLRRSGFRILRFWNSDVIENVDGVLTVIVETLKMGGEASTSVQLSGGSPTLSLPRKGGGDAAALEEQTSQPQVGSGQGEI